MSADTLLINNNNTRTKFALADLSAADSLSEERAISSRSLNVETIGQAIAGWSIRRVLLASVVPASLPILRDALRHCKLIELSHHLELGVQLDFPDPGKIGADRLANAAAVSKSAREIQSPIIVVDFGTAVTFDIVDQRPAYVGGVIAPGLDSMTDYLHHRTALLPQITIEKPSQAIGKSTEEAMQSGAFHGYRGLIREIISQVQDELQSSAQVIATGGYAQLMAKEFPEIDSIDPLLTMRGLFQIAKLNL